MAPNGGNHQLRKKIETKTLETILVGQQQLKEDIASSAMSPESTVHLRSRLELLQELEKFSRTVTAKEGSVIFSITCPTVEALDDIRDMCISGKLARMLSNAFLTEENRHCVTFNVTFDEKEWSQCRTQLLSTRLTGEVQVRFNLN